MMDITATDLVTVRRDDLLAMESEIKGLKAYADRLAAGLPDGMLPKDVENLRTANAGLAQDVQDLTAQLAEMTQARDAAVLVAGVYQAQADAEHCRAVQLINRVTEVQLERGLLQRQLADAEFTIGKERKNRKRNKLSANVCIERIREELERRDEPGDKLNAIRDIVEGV